MDVTTVLVAIADYAKRDITFFPIKDKATTRWHATVRGREFELLLTGPKFWDTRLQKGGGGAVDLAEHLFRIDFKEAVGELRKKRL